MLIDWFTVTAQIVNFLILVYLLKRFLYKPILKAMDEREQKIARRLQEAAAKRDKAETEAQALAGERRDLENRKEQLQAQAREEIEQWRNEAMDKARQEADKVRQSWQEAIAREQEDFNRRLKITLNRQIFKVAAKALQDLTDDRLEAALVEKFRQKLPEAAEENDQPQQDMGQELEIRSGFELTEAQQQDLRAAVGRLFPEAEVAFRVEPEAGFGLSLLGSSRKIEWSLGRYMAEMEKSILNTVQTPLGERK